MLVIMRHEPMVLRLAHRWHSSAEPFHDKTVIERYYGGLISAHTARHYAITTQACRDV